MKEAIMINVKKIFIIFLIFVFFPQHLWAYDATIKTIRDIAAIYQTPERVGWWISRNIYYRSDYDKWKKPDYWQTSEETLKIDPVYGERTGDCEDMAILAQDVLHLLHYTDAFVLVVYQRKTKKHHAVCVFYYRNQYCYLDNGTFKTTGTRNLLVVKKIIEESYKK